MLNVRVLSDAIPKRTIRTCAILNRQYLAVQSTNLKILCCVSCFVSHTRGFKSTDNGYFAPSPRYTFDSVRGLPLLYRASLHCEYEMTIHIELLRVVNEAYLLIELWQPTAPLKWACPIVKAVYDTRTTCLCSSTGLWEVFETKSGEEGHTSNVFTWSVRESVLIVRVYSAL